MCQMCIELADKGLMVPVIRVPHAKVYFGMEDVSVKHVLDVHFMGRAWSVDKTYAEIKDFIAGLGGSAPSLPAYVVGWNVEKSWTKIAERKRRVEKCFDELTRRGTYTQNARAFDDFLDVANNLHELTKRGPTPSVLNTAWWASLSDTQQYLGWCGMRFTCLRHLPEDVLLCTANSTIQQDGARGVRISLVTQKAASIEATRVRMLENCIFYGWAVEQKGVPRVEHARVFMKQARMEVRQRVIDGTARLPSSPTSQSEEDSPCTTPTFSEMMRNVKRRFSFASSESSEKSLSGMSVNSSEDDIAPVAAVITISVTPADGVNFHFTEAARSKSAKRAKKRAEHQKTAPLLELAL